MLSQREISPSLQKRSNPDNLMPCRSRLWCKRGPLLTAGEYLPSGTVAALNRLVDTLEGAGARFDTDGGCPDRPTPTTIRHELAPDPDTAEQLMVAGGLIAGLSKTSCHRRRASPQQDEGAPNPGAAYRHRLAAVGHQPRTCGQVIIGNTDMRESRDYRPAAPGTMPCRRSRID